MLQCFMIHSPFLLNDINPIQQNHSLSFSEFDFGFMLLSTGRSSERADCGCSALICMELHQAWRVQFLEIVCGCVVD